MCSANPRGNCRRRSLERDTSTQIGISLSVALAHRDKAPRSQHIQLRRKPHRQAEDAGAALRRARKTATEHKLCHTLSNQPFKPGPVSIIRREIFAANFPEVSEYRIIPSYRFITTSH
jgi:hypothetical protein